MTTNGWPGDVLLAGIVLLGSSVQWLTGMGFALVAVPALVLLLGPVDGVVLANCAAGAISIVGLAGGWRRVRPGAMVPLCVAAACTVPAGAWMTRQLPEPVLLLVMGGLVTAAVLLVMRGARVPALRGTKGAVAAGAVGGFMNSAAGWAGHRCRCTHSTRVGRYGSSCRTRSSTGWWSTRSRWRRTGCRS